MLCENTNNYITIYSYFLFELTRLQVLIENLCKDAKIDTLNTLTQGNSFTAIAWREYCKIISNYSDSVLSMLVHLYDITFLSYFDSALYRL
jgi:hypothetical protein